MLERCMLVFWAGFLLQQHLSCFNDLVSTRNFHYTHYFLHPDLLEKCAENARNVFLRDISYFTFDIQFSFLVFKFAEKNFLCADWQHRENSFQQIWMNPMLLDSFFKKPGVLDGILNFVWWWGSSSGNFHCCYSQINSVLE